MPGLNNLCASCLDAAPTACHHKGALSDVEGLITDKLDSYNTYKGERKVVICSDSRERNKLGDMKRHRMTLLRRFKLMAVMETITVCPTCFS